MLKLIPPILVLISRFGFFPPNFSPLGSHSFFQRNILLAALPVLVFDILSNGFYKGFIFTYLGFLGYFLLGRFSDGKTIRQIALIPAASLLFFILSNLGVWLGWYPLTFEGLIRCYTNAFPFYYNTLLSDLLFGYGYLAFLRLFERYSPAVKSFITKFLHTY